MKRSLTVALAVFLAVTMAVPMLSVSTDAAVIVNGTVTGEDNAPLGGVMVTVLDSANAEYTAATDADGEFTVENIADGGIRYTIKFERAGYAVSECGDLEHLGKGLYDLGTITADVTGMTVKMSETVAVSGRVLADGAELDGVTVDCLVSGESAMYTSSVTDSHGMFVLDVMASKTYSVGFVKDGYKISYCSLPSAPGGYYTLGPADLGYVSAVMDRLVARTAIEGTVVAPDREGYGLPGVTVSVSGLAAVLPVTTDADGKFRFDGIETGKKYTLEFIIEIYGVADAHGLSNESGAWTIDLTGASGPADVYVVMSRTYGTLTGEIKNERGSGLSEVHISVIGPSGVIVASGISSGGKYTISDIPTGRYDVRINRSDLETQTETGVYIGENVANVGFSTKTKMTTYALGLNLTHTMMLTGIILGAAVISVAVAYRMIIGRAIPDRDNAEEDDYL